MSNAELIYAAVVLLVGIPAMLRNWTAVALVACYLFMQGSFYGLGLVYPVSVSVMADLTVALLILFKEPARDLWPYCGWKDRLRAFWFELSRWDRVVMALFPVGWAFYLLAAQPYWPLWFISIAQLLAAGFEAWEVHRSTRSAKRAPAPDHPSGFEFTGGWRKWSHG